MLVLVALSSSVKVLPCSRVGGFKRVVVILSYMTIREVNDPSNTSVMPQITDYGLEDVVYWVLSGLGGSVDGLKKLMKLLFLVQYDVVNSRFLGKRAIKYLYGGKPITRAEFYLWSFGPMSNEVYNIIDELEDSGFISTEFIDNVFTRVVIRVSGGVEGRVTSGGGC